MRCSRCGVSVQPGQEEACWYCIEPLCYPCWDTFGHCGHAAADEINRRSAAGEYQDIDWNSLNSSNAGQS